MALCTGEHAAIPQPLLVTVRALNHVLIPIKEDKLFTKCIWCHSVLCLHLVTWWELGLGWETCVAQLQLHICFLFYGTFFLITNTPPSLSILLLASSKKLLNKIFYLRQLSPKAAESLQQQEFISARCSVPVKFHHPKILTSTQCQQKK